MTEGYRAGEDEEAAAEEAGAIGGPDPDPNVDPSERARRESGEGESEGFELAEEELERNATHDDPAGNPMLDRFSDEDADSGATYGDADDSQDDETAEEFES